MKNIYMKIGMMSLLLVMFLTGCEYDDSHLSDRIDGLEDRIEKLEEICRGMNSDIAVLEQLVAAMQNNQIVSKVEPMVENGETVGYVIVFQNGETVIIRHGADGKDGQDGVDGADTYIPQIGIAKDSDGIYYWTLDGEWMLDADGKRIPAEGHYGTDGTDGEDGTDGQDGVDGENGTDGQDGIDGTDGRDGITPKLKIGEDGYWYVSMDNGSSWERLVPATGTPGQDGTDGAGIFSGVEVRDGVVYITLVDGSQIELPMSTASKYDEVSSISLAKFLPISVNRVFGKPKSRPQVDVCISPVSAIEGLKENWEECIYVQFEDPVHTGKLIRLPVEDPVFRDEVGIVTFTINTDPLPEFLFDPATLGYDPGVVGIYMVYDNGERQLFSQERAMSFSDDSRKLLYVATGAMDISPLSEGIEAGLLYHVFDDDYKKGSIVMSEEAVELPAFLPSDAIIEIEVRGSGTVSFPERAFSGLSNLRRFWGRIPMVLGKGAFEDCPNLWKVQLDVVDSILPERTFKNCKSLSEFDAYDIPLKTIGKEAFLNCGELMTTYIMRTTKVEDYAFRGCASLRSLSIWSNGDVFLGTGAFMDCTGLRYIGMGRLMWLSEDTFRGCSSLEYLDTDIYKLEKNAIAGCTNLDMSRFISRIVGEIGEEEFVGLDVRDLESIRAERIGRRAFYNSTALYSIDIGEEVKSIGEEAFAGCTALTYIDVTGMDVPTLGTNAFPFNETMSIRIWKNYEAYLQDPGWSVYKEYM